MEQLNPYSHILMLSTSIMGAVLRLSCTASWHFNQDRKSRDLTLGVKCKAAQIGQAVCMPHTYDCNSSQPFEMCLTMKPVQRGSDRLPAALGPAAVRKGCPELDALPPLAHPCQVR
jgi:hypothetical protein